MVPGNILMVQDAKKPMQGRMALLGLGNLIALVVLLAQLGVPGTLLRVPGTLLRVPGVLMVVHGALLGWLALLATVVQLATVALLKLEAPGDRAYAPGSGCLRAA